MSGPAVPADDQFRRAVQALPLTPALPLGERAEAVRLLLPIVRAYADQRAVEELRRMADWIDGEAFAAPDRWPALGLRNRADTLGARGDRT